MQDFKENIEKELFSRNIKNSAKKLSQYKVGIAGAGGLGSNIAFSLVRAGIKKLVIADFDKIEASNLNRQQYFYNQIGMLKVTALKENLLRINPNIEITIVKTKLDKENITDFFHDCDIMLEALDNADTKALLVNKWLSDYPDKFIIVGSGLGGVGNFNSLHIRKISKLIICGDEKTPSSEGLMAPRILIVANMQANEALQILLNKKKG